jgi:ribonuclease P protein component
MRVERLKRPRDFGRTVSSGTRYTNRWLVLFVSKAPGEPTRVGFAAARSAGTAVKRNRIRRRLRAAVAGLHRPFCPGRRIVVLGRAPVLDASWQDLVDGLTALLDRGKCLEGDRC